MCVYIHIYVYIHTPSFRFQGFVRATKDPVWGYPRPVLGAVDPFLEPFRGRLWPNIDNVSEKLTLRYPHEGPWVV